MEERRCVYRFLVGKPEGKTQFEDPGIDGRIILRLIFRKWDMGLWTGSSWLRVRDRWRTLVNVVMNFWVP